MLKSSIKAKILIILLSFMISVTCTACENGKGRYLVGQYFDDLATKSGLSIDSTSEEALINWDVIDKRYDLSKRLEYDLLASSLVKMMEVNVDDNLSYLKDLAWIKEHVKSDDYVNRDIANSLIDKTLAIINNRQIEDYYDIEFRQDYRQIDESIENFIPDETYQSGDYIYSNYDEMIYRLEIKEGGTYEYVPCAIEEVFYKLDLSSSSVIDFSEAVVEPYGEEVDNDLYVDRFKLLAKNNNVFYVNGFRISYTLSTSKIRFYVSRKTDKGLNIYGEFSLYNINPDFIWKYNDGNIEHAYFKLKFETSESLGVSKGKYQDLAINFNNLDTSSILSTIKSSLKPLNDKVDTTIPICKIRVPIANIPFVYLNLDLSLHMYVSGKVELAISDDYCVGFEVKNNNLRLIFEDDHDIDAIINASANTSLGADFHLDVLNQSLMNVDIRAGIRAYIQAIMHIYDKDGKLRSKNMDEAYDLLDESTKNIDEVKVCGDLSFHWLLDLVLNSPNTLLGRIGLSKTFEILDDDNQVFNNLSHIENGQFVKKCTRMNRLESFTNNEISSDKIILSKYSAVVKKGETYKIPLKSLPQGYDREDLVYSSEDENVCRLTNDDIFAVDLGSTIITIKTKDGKYQAKLNILVSDG